jgi:hypothetical protein
MFGFSWEACIGLVVALFILLVVCPAGPKKTANQVISAQTYYGGAFLSILVVFVNIIIYTWLADMDVSSQPIASLLSIWGAIASSIFGAFYWTALCLYFIKKIKTRAGLVILIVWPLLMLALNYTGDIYHLTIQHFPLVALRSTTTDAIVTGLCLFAIVGFSYPYHTYKHIWKDE